MILKRHVHTFGWMGLMLGSLAFMCGCSTNYWANRGRDLLDIVEINGGLCVYGENMRTPSFLVSAQATRGGHFAVGNALVTRSGLYAGRFSTWTESGSAFPLAPFAYFSKKRKARKPDGPAYTDWRYDVFDRWDYFLGLPSYYRDLWQTRPEDVELGIKSESWTHWFDVGAEAALLVPDARVGFSPGELADFILGFLGLDAAADDILPDRKQEAALRTALATARDGGADSRRRAIVLAYRYADKPGAAAIFQAAAEFEDARLRGLGLYLMRRSTLPASSRVPILVKFFDDANSSLREVAIVELGKMGNKAASSIPILIETMDEAEHPVDRVLAADSLRDVALHAGEVYTDMAAKALARHLENPDEVMRLSAFRALEEFGSRAGVAVPSLIQAMKNPSWEYKRDAIRLLGRMGAAAREAGPFLKTLLKDPDPRVQKEAAKSLRRIGAE